MTEGSGEHHSHHAKDSVSMYVLPISILLAAIIVGYSMMTAAATIATGLDGVTINGGTGDTVVPAPDDGTLQPPAAKTIAELSQNFASKIGSDSAPIVMVEFSDYQCPFCRRHFEETHGQLMEKYVNTGKLQIVFKDFPLSFHPMAGPSANAARCAGDQGKYWEMHDKMFTEEAKGGTGTVSYTVDDLKKWGSEIGLNTATFNACVDAGTYNSQVTSNMNDGSVAGVSGTPSFFIGPRGGTGQLVVGAQPYSVFESAIEASLN